MFFAVLPKPHSEYLKSNPHNAYSYLHGEPPVSKRQGFISRWLGRSPAMAPPDDWPAPGASIDVSIDENLGTGSDEMHFLLNGTNENVHGVQNIFQTWIAANDGVAAYVWNGDGGVFFHTAEQAIEMLAFLSSLNESDIEKRWHSWNEQMDLENSKEEFDFIFESILSLKNVYKLATEKNWGVMWAPSS